jgi:hypothetical protein
MDKQQILEIAKNDSRFSQAVLALENEIGNMPVTIESLDEIVQMLEFALNNPDKYPEVLQAAIDDDLIDPGDLPEQFDPVAIISILVLMYGMQERNNQKQGFARGGLASVASKGRHGDTMLAHINPQEAEMLKAMGGSGSINPQTGLPEFFSFKKFIKAALPIALSFIAPGLGTAIGSAILGTGASALATGALGGALLGGGTAALTGGDWKKGLLMGGLGGGLGGAVGGAANSALGLGLGQTGQAILGGGLVGGVAGAATGQGFGRGALQGAAGTALGELVGGAGGPTAFGQGVQAAGRTFGQGVTAGYDAKTAAGMGALSGLATGMMSQRQPASSGKAPTSPRGYDTFEDIGTGVKPSDAVVQGLKAPTGTSGEFGRFGTTNFATGEQGYIPGQAPQMFGSGATTAVPGMEGATGSGLTAPASSPLSQMGAQVNAPAASTSGMNLNASNVLGGLTLLSALQPPPAAQEAIKKMSPEQQEYFNRPSVAWDWNKMQSDANAANMSLDQFMAANWPRITGYAQAQPGQVASMQGSYNMPQAPTVNKARGGALSAVARFAQGAGSGRADTIDAKLSDGEYVIDSETVGLLGDGSNKEGARRLDAMREGIRSHKGKVLAKGKISPNAKSPLSYLKGVA